MFERLIRGGVTHSRNGSGAPVLCDIAAGRLLRYVVTHITAWDCLAAIAVMRAAGLMTDDLLSDDGPRNGNPVVVGNAQVFPERMALNRG